MNRTTTTKTHHPFGSLQVGRVFNGTGYKYGFNEKENDLETKTQDYGFRIYNPSLGKFLSVDPLTKEYPWYTPYQFAGNKPIAAIDIDGAEEFLVIRWMDGDKLRGVTIFKLHNTQKIDINSKMVVYKELPLSEMHKYVTSNGKAFKNINFIPINYLNNGKHKEFLARDKSEWVEGFKSLENGFINGGQENYNSKPGITPVDPSQDYLTIPEIHIDIFLPSPEDITFNTGSDKLDKNGENNLDAIVGFLEMFPTATITIEGHTDNVGTKKDNLILSQKRAKSAEQYLISKGVDPNRIKSVKGYGADKPKNNNSTPAEKKANRRIEIGVIE